MLFLHHFLAHQRNLVDYIRKLEAFGVDRGRDDEAETQVSNIHYNLSSTLTFI